MCYKPGEVDYAEALQHEKLKDVLYDGVVECMDGCLVEPVGLVDDVGPARLVAHSQGLGLLLQFPDPGCR